MASTVALTDLEKKVGAVGVQTESEKQDRERVSSILQGQKIQNLENVNTWDPEESLVGNVS